MSCFGERRPEFRGTAPGNGAPEVLLRNSAELLMDVIGDGRSAGRRHGASAVQAYNAQSKPFSLASRSTVQFPQTRFLHRNPRIVQLWRAGSWICRLLDFDNPA